MVKMKRVRSKKQALEDFAEHCDAMSNLGYGNERLQEIMSTWASHGTEMYGSQDEDEHEAAIILSFATLGVKAFILQEIGARVSIAQAEGDESELEP
jgi:hypothetical protein